MRNINLAMLVLIVAVGGLAATTSGSAADQAGRLDSRSHAGRRRARR